MMRERGPALPAHESYPTSEWPKQKTGAVLFSPYNPSSVAMIYWQPYVSTSAIGLFKAIKSIALFPVSRSPASIFSTVPNAMTALLDDPFYLDYAQRLSRHCPSEA